jgi:hypothetical protein
MIHDKIIGFGVLYGKASKSGEQHKTAVAVSAIIKSWLYQLNF